MRTESHDAVVCPCCGEEHGDAWEWAQDAAARMTYQEYDREFVYWAEREVNYNARDIESGEMLKAALTPKPL